nr:uncharacterized protein C19orf47 homolog isoform X2 [Chlorocebus sabaeus]
MAALSLVAAWWARAAAGGSVQLPAAPGSSVRARETMVSVTMATSEWIQFFKEAGIPPGPAVNYAVMFVDNRIQKSMLLDLNKEIMNELGVTVVGDIIAILKHAKVVHRQDMCKAATESVPCSPSPLAGEIRRGTSAASRMITNSLNHDSPPSTPPRRPDTSTSKISVTVSNKMAAKSAKATALACQEEESLAVPAKRRRVTAEMEGKYVINMPKGTTPRTRKILEQQQAAKGLHRTSVFDRLGAETKADTTTGSKPTGVFSRLGATPETDEDLAWDSDNDSSSSVLQYAGVLKKLGRGPAKASPQPALTVKAKATSSATTAAAPTLRRLALSSRSGLERKPESLSKVSIIKRLGAATLVPEAQDSQVTSTKRGGVAEGVPSWSGLCMAQANRYLIRGNKRIRLMFGAVCKLVSEPGGQPFEMISRCWAQSIFSWRRGRQ